MGQVKIPSIIDIQGVLVSADILEKSFCCDLSQCKGICCVSGASGAPLEEDEDKFLQENLEVILPYLPKKNQEVIRKNGVSRIDEDGDLVTTLVNNQECSFSYQKDGITFCGIEEAYNNEKTPFQKPISCHLFPIRAKKYNEFEAINYEYAPICRTATVCGKQKNLPLYQFLKEPLIRKFGKEWYNELCLVAEAFIKNNQS